MLYREAKNKKHEITIIKQLTGYSDLQIEYILKKGGVLELKDDKKAMIMEQYNKGLSDTDIARETGIAQSQVSTFLRGEKLPANGKAWGGKKKEAVVSEMPEKVQEVKAPEKIEKEDKAVEEIKIVQPEVKQEKQAEVIKNLKSETQKNYEELKEVLPKSIPNPEDMPINYDVIETLTPQQYYELAKMTIELLKTIWG